MLNLELIHKAYENALALTQTVQLFLGDTLAKGYQGNTLSPAAGSSLEFRDERAYYPGDNPRYIDWRNYARSKEYTVKLFHEEKNPLVDVVLDVSQSMFFTHEKALRSLELFFLSTISTTQQGLSSRCIGFYEEKHEIFTHEQLLSSETLFQSLLEKPRQNEGMPLLDSLPLRNGSLRILISDLLFPINPQEVVKDFARSMSRGVIFAPYCKEESDPDWYGPIEFEACENTDKQHHYVEHAMRERYVDAYDKHFGLWAKITERHRMNLIRTYANEVLIDSVTRTTLPTGVCVPCN